MMRPIDIEGWTLHVIDAVEAGTPVEDDRVELKRQWIEPSRAARRLAGMANSAHGEPVLWVIGVDEKSGVTGLQPNDFAAWWQSVEARFDEVAPEVQSLVVPTGRGTVMALLVTSDRAPYVIKTPGDHASREVPWRTGTRTRSANRSDLIRMLAPVSRLPRFEIRGASLERVHTPGSPSTDQRWTWFARAEYYVELTGGDLVVIPDHRCHITATVPELNFRLELADVYVAVPGEYSTQASISIRSAVETPRYFTASRGRDQTMIEGPGLVQVRGKTVTNGAQVGGTPDIMLAVALTPVAAAREFADRLTLKPTPSTREHEAKWVLAGGTNTDEWV